MKLAGLFHTARIAGALALLLLSAHRTAPAQILYGGLVGNVTDSSSAAVPNAKVTIVHVATGTTRETATNEMGTYRFPTIAPGTYELTVQANGFRTFSRTGIEVAVNNLTRVEARLEVGDVTERMTVEASAAALQTDRAEVRHEVAKETL